jgi:hypothetical protein
MDTGMHLFYGSVNVNWKLEGKESQAGLGCGIGLDKPDILLRDPISGDMLSKIECLSLLDQHSVMDSFHSGTIETSWAYMR